MLTVMARWQSWLTSSIAATLIIRILRTAIESHWQVGLALIAVLLVRAITLTYVTRRPISE